MFCHKCGNKIVDDAAFCPKCGTKIATGEATPQASATPAPPATAAPVTSTGDDVSGLLARLPIPKNDLLVQSWELSAQATGSKENCLKCSSGDVVPVVLRMTGKAENATTAFENYFLCKSCGHHFKAAKDEYKSSMIWVAIMGVLGVLLIPVGTIWLSGIGGIISILVGIACLGYGIKKLHDALKAKARINGGTAQASSNKLLFGIIGVVIAILIVVIALFVSNQNGGSLLVGTWSSDYLPVSYYVFHEDGRGTRGAALFLESFAWRVESGNTVVMTFQTNVETHRFTIRGDSLTFTGDDWYAPFTRVSSAAVPSASVGTAQPETSAVTEIPANVGGVNAETFAFIRDGMSIDEVQELIGAVPASETNTEMAGITSTIIMWTEGLTTITVGFTNGFVTSTQIMTMGDGAVTPPATNQGADTTATRLTEGEVLVIAQQFLDAHPLYVRTLTGGGTFEPTGFSWDTTNLYIIELLHPDGSLRSMWVHGYTGEVYISPDGNVLISGAEFYDWYTDFDARGVTGTDSEVEMYLISQAWGDSILQENTPALAVYTDGTFVFVENILWGIIRLYGQWEADFNIWDFQITHIREPDGSLIPLSDDWLAELGGGRFTIWDAGGQTGIDFDGDWNGGTRPGDMFEWAFPPNTPASLIANPTSAW